MAQMIQKTKVTKVILVIQRGVCSPPFPPVLLESVLDCHSSGKERIYKSRILLLDLSAQLLLLGRRETRKRGGGREEEWERSERRRKRGRGGWGRRRNRERRRRI